MKIKDGFLLKKVADTFVVVPIGDNLVDFNSMITLNETGAFLWEKLNNECTEQDLIEEIFKEYDVDKETAQNDVNEFVEMLKTKKVLD